MSATEVIGWLAAAVASAGALWAWLKGRRADAALQAREEIDRRARDQADAAHREAVRRELADAQADLASKARTQETAILVDKRTSEALAKRVPTQADLDDFLRRTEPGTGKLPEE